MFLKNQMIQNNAFWLTFFCVLLSFGEHFYLIFAIITFTHHPPFFPPFDDEEGLRTVFARGV